MNSRNAPIIGSLLIVILFLFSGLSAIDQGINSPMILEGPKTVNADAIAIPQASLRMVPVPASNNSISRSANLPYNGETSVMVTFSLQNQSVLSSFLSNLSNPHSSQYHRYITRSQFASKFAISADMYSQAVSYFKKFPDLSVYRYGDRVSLEVKGPAKELGNAFNTTIAVSPDESQLYFASSAPDLPLYLAKHVSEVTGLSNSRSHVDTNLFSKSYTSSPNVSASANDGFPSPISSNGVQYLYGSDFQVAYDEQSLLNTTFPTNEVIATILWAGHNSAGTPVGAFDPSDISAYYNATLPSYEPHSRVYGVPLNGAVKPGVSASYDVTGANQENTLDLEMVGSTAPGSSIYNVYGPSSSNENIDSSFAFILNPNSTYSALNNVSVITNSWGACEHNNTVWYQYLQEAQARGITVLASSGDSGDNNASSKYTGSQLEFPAVMAYNTFGVTAVGGTTLTLTQNLHILNQTAWYTSSGDSADGGPVGSVGGISTVFKEPDFQLKTEANNVLLGRGRGVPDISAVANNTLVYLTVNGTSHYANPSLFWGTSIASPVEAGIIAEIDAVLNHYKKPNLGYLNPMIYNMANKQIKSPTRTSTLGFIQTGSYNSSLPALPFYNTMYGRNHVYNATFGYNLVTGWGSIDAYNLTMYILNINRSQSQNGLKGVYDKLSLEGLNVTSYLYHSSTDSCTTNLCYNASIQQNLFLANQFGAPLYWIQNVVYIYGSQSAGWVVNYTGWVVYPFFGQYPSQTVYEYNFPMGKLISMPHVFNVRTWISNLSDPMHQTANFQLNSQIIRLPVPGAAYIIDSHINSQNYSYTWQGKTYYNGPYPDNPNPGGLNPQFGLVGGPSGGLGHFANATHGTISAYVEPIDSDSYVPAISKVLNLSVDETGEVAVSLNFAQVNSSTWSLSVKQNSQSQGLVDYAPDQYSQTFEEQGLPSGTAWSIILNGDKHSSTSSSLTVPLVNGSYTAQVSSPAGYFSTPSKWLFTVKGQSSTVPIAYASSSNETYIKPAVTLYPLTNQTFTGSVLNSSFMPGTLSLGMAYDSSSGLIFIPEFSSSVDSIYVYNTTTSQFVKTISGLYSYDALYNPTTGMVYSMSANGNLTEINPSTMSVVKNLTLPDSVSNFPYLQQQANTIYALSSNGNISIINALSLSLTKTIRIEPAMDISSVFAVYRGNAFVANTTGNNIVITNLTTSARTQVYLPHDYTPLSVVNFYGSNLLIGGENYTNQIYNASSGLISSISKISLTAFSTTYDSSSNMVYVASFPYDGFFGNITVVNPANGKIIARIPSVGPSLGMIFNSVNQNIYTINYQLGIVSVYSVQHYYKATFTESGLPTGTTWYVNLTNGMSSGAITGSSYSFELTNASYTYSVSSVSGYTILKNETGSVTVSGHNQNINILFGKLYAVTFTENNLPPGTVWYVNVTNGHKSGPITGTHHSFELTNASYTYSVSSVSGFTILKNATGSVTVSGHNQSINIPFGKLYSVTFTESGLPSGTTWYVNVSGHLHSSHNSTITVYMNNDTYHYTVTAVNGYTISRNATGNITVNGNSVSISISFTKNANYSDYYIIGGVVAAIVIIGGVFVFIRRKK